MTEARFGKNNIQRFQHPDQLPKDVQQLIASAEETSMEFGATWYRNLVSTVYQSHAGVYFYVLRHAQALIAVLPVLVDREFLGNHVKSLANYYTALYAPIVAPGTEIGDLVPLINGIRSMHAPLGLLRFAPMDSQSRGYDLLHGALRASGLATFKFYCFGNWYLPVRLGWKEYLASRDGQLRSTIKRMGKKFAAEGGVMEIVKDGDTLEAALDAYKKVYAASWKVAEPFPEFVPGLIRACAERGWLRLGVARLKGEPVAAQIWIVTKGKANIYKLAYHQDFKSYAPGTLLTAMLMQYVIEQDRVAEIDYLIGDDPYKKSWMNDRRERWGIIAYDPRTAAGLLGLVLETGSRAAGYLRSKWRREGSQSQ